MLNNQIIKRKEKEMLEMFFLLLLPLGAAIAARLRYQDWRFWAGWIGSVIVVFTALWILPPSPKRAFLLVSAASAAGFTAPELWESLRSALRRPRNWLYLVSAGGALYVFFHRELWGPLLMLGIVFLGIWIILRPLIRR